jgi:hypothetical protein
MESASQMLYDEDYLNLCLEGLYDLMKLKEVIFRYRVNYKKYNLYGKHTYLEEKYSHMDFEDFFMRKFNSMYTKYATIIEENKGYNNEIEISLVISAIRHLLVLYSSLVEDKEYERIFYQRILDFEPPLILVNDLKSEFKTILFGYADIANSAHSPVIATHASSNPLIATHASSNEIDLNEPKVTNAFSYPEIRILNPNRHLYRTQRLSKNGLTNNIIDSTNVLKVHLETRKRNRLKKKPPFRKPTNKNTKKTTVK